MGEGARPQWEALFEALTDLMRGGRHSRWTIARQYGVTPATGDRWLRAFNGLPGTRLRRVGRTAWYEWECPADRRPKEE
jgi:hypothetical protein